MVWALIALGWQTGANLILGPDTFQLDEATYLARFGFSASFSRDGRYVLFSATSDEATASTRRLRRATGNDEPTSYSVIRYDADAGQRTVLARLPRDQRVEFVGFVGTSGDAFFASERTADGTRVYDLWYAPLSQPARVLATVPSRIPISVTTSRVRPEALVITQTADRIAKLFVLDSRGIGVVEGTGSLEFGQAYGPTKNGTFIAALTTPSTPPVGSIFEIDPRTRTAVPREEAPDTLGEDEEDTRQLDFENIEQGRLPAVKENFDRVLLARARGTSPGGTGRVLVFRSTVAAYETSPNGLRIVANTETGFFFREFVKLNPPK